MSGILTTDAVDLHAHQQMYVHFDYDMQSFFAHCVARFLEQCCFIGALGTFNARPGLVIKNVKTFHAALLCHEYLLTFDREVEFFWRRKLTVASLVFYINRYGALFGAFLALRARFYHDASPEVCHIYHRNIMCNLYDYTEPLQR